MSATLQPHSMSAALQPSQCVCSFATSTVCLQLCKLHSVSAAFQSHSMSAALQPPQYSAALQPHSVSAVLQTPSVLGGSRQMLVNCSHSCPAQSPMGFQNYQEDRKGVEEPCLVTQRTCRGSPCLLFLWLGPLTRQFLLLGIGLLNLRILNESQIICSVRACLKSQLTDNTK